MTQTARARQPPGAVERAPDASLSAGDLSRIWIMRAPPWARRRFVFAANSVICPERSARRLPSARLFAPS
ncbi:hypothetical protein MRX96_010391 [Rhipicephalus microplus]